MGWQDRDYAQSPVKRTTLPAALGGGSPLIYGSITTTLIVINVVIFLLAELSQSFASGVYTWGSLVPRDVLHGQVWRLLTWQYLHWGVVHLLMNMIGLNLFGRELERSWSPRRFLAVYTAGGLFASLFYVLLSLGSNPVINEQARAVGASGNIFALMGVVAVRYPNLTVSFWGIVPVRMVTLAAAFGFISLMTVIQRGDNFGGEACHLAGLLFGVWWAMAGERWWGETEWVFLPRRQRTGKQRNPNPDGWRRKLEDRNRDAKRVDELLDKIRDHGLTSLSEQERNELEQARKRMVEADRDMGNLR